MSYVAGQAQSPRERLHDGSVALDHQIVSLSLHRRTVTLFAGAVGTLLYAAAIAALRNTRTRAQSGPTARVHRCARAGARSRRGPAARSAQLSQHVSARQPSVPVLHE